ncbi:hypothetical protein NDU88_003357 [Pleurodeles waltl]|uniref:Secreted protein n=1 Tax=Pleurodeles waltl TaxID=8319 RepID=A0AAV7WNW8_PLEWA|nr:hypothetical protein NDU88_003357 [Pleurodeles waltl]
MPWRRVLSMLWKRVVSANTIHSRMCACHFKQRLDTLPGCLEESPSVVLETRACRRTPTQFSVVLETHLRLALGEDVSMPRAWCASTISVPLQY